jgi:hypothetical protein
MAIIVAFASDRTRQRGIYLALFGSIAMIGYAILRVSTSSKVKYGAVFIVAFGAFPNGPGFLAWGINSELRTALYIQEIMANNRTRFWICSFSSIY